MDFEATILSVTKVTHDVTRIMLTRHDEFSFVPGQYGLVFLEDEGKPFTFTSIPDDAHLELTVKEKGDFTAKLVRCQPGDILTIRGPLGQALNFTDELSRVIFVAGGSGITPFISFLRHVYQRGLDHQFVLFYANKTREDVIYGTELEAYQSVRLIHAFSEQGAYVTKELIQSNVDDPARHTWLVCGPPPMTASLRKILSELGAADVRIEP
ncbi:MAG: FAD-binding oxidoreductase, partial [Nanobdellota archaeon]